MALSKLPEPIFAVFAIQMDGVILYAPDELTAFLTHNGTVPLPKGVWVLPWHTGAMELDLANTAQVESQLETINSRTDAIDAEDPWVLQTFGIRGPGEGLVWYPINVDVETGEEEEKPAMKARAVTEEVYSTFVFKTKGEKHRVVGTRKAAQVKPESAADATKYAELMLPEPRLQQGTSPTGMAVAMRDLS